MKSEIEESAFGYHERYRTGQDIVVGVNKYVTEELEVPDILKVDQASEDAQVERLKALQGEPRPGAGATAPRGAQGSRARGTRTCCPASARPSRTAPRSARSAARCATSSASTSPTRSAQPMIGPAVEFYDVVVWLHISSVVIGFGVTFVYPLIFAVATRSDPRAPSSPRPRTGSSSSPIATSRPRATVR